MKIVDNQMVNKILKQEDLKDEFNSLFKHLDEVSNASKNMLVGTDEETFEKFYKVLQTHLNLINKNVHERYYIKLKKFKYGVE